MASYDLVERLNNTFRQIELELQALQQALSDCRLLAGRVFELPAIGKDAEHDPLATIPVVQHIGKTALARESAVSFYHAQGFRIEDCAWQDDTQHPTWIMRWPADQMP